MGAPAKREQAAIEAVARHLSATWEKTRGRSPSCYLAIAGKRVAVEVIAIAQRGEPARPRLRFDKVAMRLISGLQAALSGAVPAGKAVIVSVTAPIRLASKTGAVLESMIRDALLHRPAKGTIKDTIHANRIQVRIVSGIPGPMPRVIGFVHNPDPDPEILFNLTQALLRQIGAAADRRPPAAFTGERWLVAACERGLPPGGACRHFCSQLAMPAGFRRVLMVSAGGRVETLAG